MRYKAVLFDLDGTLLDTLADIADAMNSALASRGWPTHPVEAYRYFTGDGVENLARRTMPAEKISDETLRAELVAEMRRNYAENWDARTRPYDGVADLLDGLMQRGGKMAILSNKPHDFTKLCAERLLPNWRFDVVQGVADGVPLKPNPAGALAVAEQMGLAPARIAYLGDTATDMKTATAAGMFPIGALWGFRTADELAQSGAKTLIEHPADLLKLI